MQKIDKRKTYILVIDTETANGTITKEGKTDFRDCQVYDFGYAVIDKCGNVYDTGSFVNSQIFEKNYFMESAYYADKIPQYKEDIKSGKRILTDWFNIKQEVKRICDLYNIKAICAHNAAFDVRACNSTQRYLTKSKFRYFFPYGIEIWDSLKMARDVILKQPTYIRFCEKNGYTTATGKPKATAEILYRYIILNNDFIEKHTGLEDVLIEKEIIAYCFRQKRKMRKCLYGAKE